MLPFGLLYAVFALGTFIFVITLLWRMTIALEKTARHLLEIARDVKKLSPPSGGDEE